MEEIDIIICLKKRKTKNKRISKKNYHEANKKAITFTEWKLSKYGVFSGLYFPVFSPDTGKYGPEKTLYLDPFHAVFR